MPLPKVPKLPRSHPFANIKTWLFEKSKIVMLNPLDPSSTTMKKEKTINVTNLEKILTESHAPSGLINRIVDEVNDLIRRVTQNEADIVDIFERLEEVEQTMSTIGHGHAFVGAGSVVASTSRKGGIVKESKKLQEGGVTRTQPVPTSKDRWKQKLISEIKTLQNK